MVFVAANVTRYTWRRNMVKKKTVKAEEKKPGKPIQDGLDPETYDEEEEPEVEETEEVVKSSDMVDKANLAALRLEEANKVLAKLLVKQERLKVEKTLGGEADAGAPAKTPEEKEVEEAKKQLVGTGFEDVFDEPKEDGTDKESV